MLNNPDKYDQILCRNDLIGCSEYRSGNDITYFRDPKLNGNALCVYKPQTTAAASPSGPVKGGWFRNGTDNIPCYNGYLQSGGDYGIWSNKSKEYNGFVGICPTEQTGCTELVDRADVSTGYTKGKPYSGQQNEVII